MNIELNFPPKLRGARSRLYRRRFLQVNTRWKALAEIYTMHSFAPFWNREIFAILTLIGVWGMKIIMKVHQKMGRVSRPFFLYKMTLNGVWGQAHPKTYTSAERSDIEWGLGASTYENIYKLSLIHI